MKLDCDRVARSSKDYEDSLYYIRRITSDVLLFFNFIANTLFFLQIKISISNTQKLNIKTYELQVKRINFDFY